MSAVPSHRPFDSIFRQDYEVVVERQGRTMLFPHTQQLPVLLRALELEFRRALPDYLARVDRRGNSFQKYLLKQAVLSFTNIFNVARTDGLHLMPLTDENLVTHMAVVQQVTEETSRGKLHSFRFYAGADFQPEIRLNGRRLMFTQHIIDRFTSRVPNQLGEHLSMLLLLFLGSPIIGMAAGGSACLVLPYDDSFLALPFDVGFVEDKDNLLLLTCLTVNEIHTLEEDIPTMAFHLHYGRSYQVPRIRHWLPFKLMMEIKSKWEKKVPLPPALPMLPKELTWHWMAQRIREKEIKNGFGPGMTFAFLDHVPGPCTVSFLPGLPEPQVDERQIHKDTIPNVNWDELFDDRDYFLLNFNHRKR